MSSSEFQQKMLKYSRQAREMLVKVGDPGCKPITKISGVPWWPADLPRPICGHGHSMSFMAQFRLSDIPRFESHRDTLVFFHYCQECSYDGNMSFGCNCVLSNTNGYDVSVISAIGKRRPDNLGTVAEVVIDPYSVRFRDMYWTLPGARMSSIPSSFRRFRVTTLRVMFSRKLCCGNTEKPSRGWLISRYYAT